jgi:hypothetical protein
MVMDKSSFNIYILKLKLMLLHKFIYNLNSCV